MVEFLSAVAGASISVAAMGVFGYTRKNDEARDAIIRLTSAVEHIALQLETMHIDIKDDRREIYARLSSVEQRVTATENRR